MEKLIIDTDPGIDDALALMLLIKSGAFDIQAITTVAGNATIEKVTKNAAFILALLGRSDIPLYSGTPSPLRRPLIRSIVHGDGGLGGVDTRNTPFTITGDANIRIIELVKKYPKQITILALGPLTNIARAFKNDPKLPTLIKEIVIMGGAIDVAGNMSNASEFNMYVDPEAADIVFRSQAKKVLIPLDVCNQVVLSLSDFESLRDTSLYSVIKPLMEQYIAALLNDPKTKVKGAVIYDAVAAYYLLAPRSFKIVTRAIEVETKNRSTFGMTREKRDGSVLGNDTKVALQVNREQFRKTLFDTLQT